MNNIKNIVKLMHDCFDADKRQQSFWNIFSKTYQHQLLLTGEDELFSKKGLGFGYGVTAHYAGVLRKTLTTYKREKELLCSSFFLIGKIKNETVSKTICAPIVCFNAKLDKVSTGRKSVADFISIDKDQPLINIDVIQQIIGGDIADFPSDIFFEEINNDALKKVSDWFGKYPEIFDTSSLQEFPKLFNSEKINNIKQLATDKIFVVPAAAFLVVKKSFLSRGVLHELEKISISEKLLLSLKSFFEPEKGFFKDEGIAPIPATLSDAQKQVIQNSKNYSLSTVIGPPGTGKSYTIAALALEYFMNNKSVLIVSNTEQSISVIEQKLIQSFSVDSKALIRCGDGQYHNKLKAHIDEILNTKDFAAVQPKDDVHKIASIVHGLEKRFVQKCEKTHSHSEFIYKTKGKPKGIIDRIRLAFIDRYYRNNGHLKEDLDQILDQNIKLEEACVAHINYNWQKRISNALRKNRKQLSNFLVAIRARSSSKQNKFFDETDFNKLLEVLPIWLVSLSNLHRVLPLKSDLFDLVIFDEATQCNIASSIPAIVRAKKAVIVGDPKQLRHFSFLSRDLQNHIFQQYPFSGIPAQLNYRDESILDTAQQLLVDNNAISYLDEHFRSHPKIIGYSNNCFYDNRLKIMTQKPNVADSTPIEVSYLPDGICKKGVNRVEANNIIQRLSSIIEEQKDETIEAKTTIGVIALFTNQADYLESLVMNNLSEEQLAEHQILVGTAYSFQGEERDIMLISCCVDKDSSASNYQYMNRDDSFNVGITRARNKQILFTSATNEQLLQRSHLAKYLKYCEEVASEQKPKTYADAFQADLCNELKKYNIDIKLQFEVASIPVDIVAMHKGTVIGIDLIGFPGELSDFITLQSFKLLGRAQLSVMPISYSEWELNREKVLETILSTLNVKKEDHKSLRQPKIFGNEKAIQFTYLKENERMLSSLADELDLLDKEQDINFINNLQNSYINLISIAHIKLNPTSLSFQRFRSLAISIFEQCIQNINSIIIATKQIYLCQGAGLDSHEPENDDNDLQKVREENELLISEAQQQIIKYSNENLMLLTKMNQLSAELSKPSLSETDLSPLISEIDRHIQIAGEFSEL